jgi:hypothetical protein
MEKLNQLKKLGFILGLSLGLYGSVLATGNGGNGEDTAVDALIDQMIPRENRTIPAECGQAVFIENGNNAEKQGNFYRKVGKLVLWAFAVGEAIVISKEVYDHLPPQSQEMIDSLIERGQGYIIAVGSGMKGCVIGAQSYVLRFLSSVKVNVLRGIEIAGPYMGRGLAGVKKGAQNYITAIQIINDKVISNIQYLLSGIKHAAIALSQETNNHLFPESKRIVNSLIERGQGYIIAAGSGIEGCIIGAKPYVQRFISSVLANGKAAGSYIQRLFPSLKTHGQRCVEFVGPYAEHCWSSVKAGAQYCGNGILTAGAKAAPYAEHCWSSVKAGAQYCGNGILTAGAKAAPYAEHCWSSVKAGAQYCGNGILAAVQALKSKGCEIFANVCKKVCQR